MSFPIKSNFPYFFASLFWSVFEPCWKDASLLHNQCFNKVKLITGCPNFPLLLMLATKASGKLGKSHRVRCQISHRPIHEIMMLDGQFRQGACEGSTRCGNPLEMCFRSFRGEEQLCTSPPTLMWPRRSCTQLLVHRLFTNTGWTGLVQTKALRRGLPLNQWKIIWHDSPLFGKTAGSILHCVLNATLACKSVWQHF